MLRHSYGIPGVIGEASFFTNPEEEQRLRDPAWNRREAEAYVRALADFFAEPVPPIRPKESVPPLEPFRPAKTIAAGAARVISDNATVTGLPEVNDEDQTVALTFLVEPGNRTYVNRINFRGNTAPADSAQRRSSRRTWFRSLSGGKGLGRSVIFSGSSASSAA